MRLMQRTLAGVLVFLASGLACADGLQWVAKDTPATLVAGGGSDALSFHVCRADVGNGVVVPGKFWTSGASGGECRIALDGQERGLAAFEVLAQRSIAEASYAWVPGHAMSYPQRSLIGGKAADGEPLLVCAAVHAADGSVHPGYIHDENCVYGKDGGQFTSANYVVLATNDAGVPTTESAQPATEGFDPGSILASAGVAALCASKEGSCLRSLPDNY
ncbi:DM9 repeat-containing protein [Ramlibacter alkalitolerans]|nr:DM9 repeat-containing protein [Ramlibacter alkalitolerans]